MKLCAWISKWCSDEARFILGCKVLYSNSLHNNDEQWQIQMGYSLLTVCILKQVEIFMKMHYFCLIF